MTTSTKPAATKKRSKIVSAGAKTLAVPENDVEARLALIEEQVRLHEEKVNFLLKGRPGRQYRPIVISKKGVCGVDPKRDSSTCEDASLWRRNKGCQGISCVAKSTEYYRQYRKDKKEAGDD